MLLTHTLFTAFISYLLVPSYLVAYPHITADIIQTLLLFGFLKGGLLHNFPPMILQEAKSYRMLHSS
jgi:hypothetical protein